MKYSGARIIHTKIFKEFVRIKKNVQIIQTSMSIKE